MASKTISNDDRQCIAGCIFKYYGSSEGSAGSDRREERYQQCLESCRVC